MVKLYLAVPCYNEEEVLFDTTEKLTKKYDQLMAEGKITDDSKIVYIDDGSKDRTWEIISGLYKTNKYVNGIKKTKIKSEDASTVTIYAPAIMLTVIRLKSVLNAPTAPVMWSGAFCIAQTKSL